MLRRWICALLALAVFSSPALALSRDELRARWREISETCPKDTPYARSAQPEELNCGELKPEAKESARMLINLLRELAGLAPVALDELYALRAQHGATLLAYMDELEHCPAQPEGVPDSFYSCAYDGTSQGNIARFNWMRPEILIDGVSYFARDDGAGNLSVLGHRRWLLNPEMAATGLGLANSAAGNSYVCMYALDSGNAGAYWDSVCWPSAGAFPVEQLRAALPWSISLNPAHYDIEASHPTILLREETSGAEFRFDPLRGVGDGFCCLSREGYGAGDCLIFRPDIAAAGIEEYVQNQRWRVRVDGLKTGAGEAAALEYVCEMVSLYPQAVANIELSQLEAQLQPGEMLQLRAQVIPAYADDLRVAWSSSDPEVAQIDQLGNLYAVSAGQCEIRAGSENGRFDVCVVTVS